jgi:energy-coupling factor transporter transmembrane protein EcfT
MRSRERMAPLLLGALAGSLVAGRVGSAAGCLALAGTCAALAGARWPRASALRIVGVGMGVAVVLNTLLVAGRPLGPVPHASVEGLRLGVLLGLRLAGAAAAVHGLAAAWPGERAADELARLLGPLERVRVPVREARVVLGLALRFVPLLAGEGTRIARIQGLRAGRPPRGWRERFTRRRAVVIPGMVNALERAERVSLAREARHHRLRVVTLPAGPAGRRAGWAWGLAGLAVAVTSLVWRG